MGEEIVAVCDVNAKTLAGAQAKAPKAKAFSDYRKLYEDLAPSAYDAVVVSTTEHTHAFATLPALLAAVPAARRMTANRNSESR